MCACPSCLPSTAYNEWACRVLCIHRACPRRPRHGCAGNCGDPSRHALFVHLGTADRASYAPWEALRAGKEVRHRDDHRTNVVGNVYAFSFRQLTSELTRSAHRSPGMPQKRNGRGTTPYVTCDLLLVF